VGIASSYDNYDAGPYSIVVSGLADSASGYESEANDSFASANAVALDVTIKGQLASPDDVDYYQVVATEAGSLSLAFSVPTSSAYPGYFRLGLYDAEATLLGYFSAGADSTYTVGAPSGGVYYVGVSGDYDNYSSGQYGLSVSNLAGSASSYESESNDSLDSADAATLDMAIQGQLASPGDVDYYQVVATAAGTLSVAFDLAAASAYADHFWLFLQDSEGQLLASFTAGADRTYTVGAQEGGTYFLGVASNHHHSAEQYKVTFTNLAESASAYESEFNDTPESANAAALGVAIAGQLASPDDVDYFRVIATAAGTLELDLDVPTSSKRTDFFELGLYDAGGIRLANFATGSDRTFTVGAPASGTYFVGITSGRYYYNSGEYSVTVTHTAGTPSGHESESNDTPGSADAATLDVAITGQLASRQDVDYYKVLATAPGTLSVAFDAPTSSRHSDYFELGLYNTAGKLLAKFSTGADKTFTVGAPASGTYYVGVACDDYYSSRPYSLTLSHEAGAASGYESESNDTLESANAAALDVAMAGQVASPGDVDFYKVFAPDAGSLSVVFDVPTTSAYADYFQLGLYDAAGTQLGRFSTGADKTYTVGAPASGTYYVGVASDDYSAGPYSFIVSNAAGPTPAYEAESNDTPGSATALTPGDAMKGQLASNIDTDCFKLTVSGPGVITLAFDAPTRSKYTDYSQVSVTDAAGNLTTSHATGTDISFQAAVGAAGDYYISVDSPDYYYDSGFYALTATVSNGNSGYELEPNDNFANALSSGVAMRGQMATASDSDWFVLTPDQPGNL